MVASRRLAVLVRHQATICFSNLRICSCSSSIWVAKAAKPSCERREARVALILDDPDQFGDLEILAGHDAELGEMGASAFASIVRCRIRRSRDPVHTHRLLFGALDRHEAHARALHRLADRLGICRVVLAPLDARLHVGGGISRTSWPNAFSSRAQ